MGPCPTQHISYMESVDPWTPLLRLCFAQWWSYSFNCLLHDAFCYRDLQPYITTLHLYRNNPVRRWRLINYLWCAVNYFLLSISTASSIVWPSDATLIIGTHLSNTLRTYSVSGLSVTLQSTYPLPATSRSSFQLDSVSNATQSLIESIWSAKALLTSDVQSSYSDVVAAIDNTASCTIIGFKVAINLYVYEMETPLTR